MTFSGYATCMLNGCWLEYYFILLCSELYVPAINLSRESGSHIVTLEEHKEETRFHLSLHNYMWSLASRLHLIFIPYRVDSGVNSDFLSCPPLHFLKLNFWLRYRWRSLEFSRNYDKKQVTVQYNFIMTVFMLDLRPVQCTHRITFTVEPK